MCHKGKLKFEKKINLKKSLKIKKKCLETIQPENKIKYL